MNYDIYLPSYSIGEDVYQKVAEICLTHGTKAVVIGGKTAMSVVKDKLLKALDGTSVEVLDFVWYGGEASYENVELLASKDVVLNADYLFAVGGGKATDTVKTLADKLQKPVYTFPTLASNCSAVTAVSIMYRPEGVFLKPHFFDKPPAHAFIDTEIIAKSPVRYCFAGIGDTYAKYFESKISSRDEEVPHYVALGVANSTMCYEPMMKYGEKALSDMAKGITSDALTQVILSVVVTTGIASILLTKDQIIDYNTGLGHAIFYALTSYPVIEEKHLHGEVVSYGILVLLLVDHNEEDFRRVYDFSKRVGLPTKLQDIDLPETELDRIATMASQMKDIDHNPYVVTKEMIAEAMQKLQSM